MSLFLDLPAKRLRAWVIDNHLRQAGNIYNGVVCFTCGNAAKALRDAGVYVVEVGGKGGLNPTKWWSFAEIARTWPNMFDATSGHLPMPLMVEIGEALKAHAGHIPKAVSVLSGSGETAVCLAIAYPDTEVTAVYDDAKPETTYNEFAPLNSLVRRLCKVERRNAP